MFRKMQTETIYSLTSESAVTFPPSAGSSVELHVEAAGRWWTGASLCCLSPAEMLVSGAAGWHLLPETALKTNMTAHSKLLIHHSADIKARKSPCEMTRSLLKKQKTQNKQKKPKTKKNKTNHRALKPTFLFSCRWWLWISMGLQQSRDVCVCVWGERWTELSLPQLISKKCIYVCVCVKDWALGKKKKDEKEDVWLLLPAWLVFNGCKLGALSEETVHE